MSISAVWKTESGDVLGRVDDSQGHLSSITHDRGRLSGTVCLRFLDPYGDAVFNQLQLPVLAGELESRAAASKQPAREHLTAVAALARKAIGEMHTYLWFIGD